MSYDSEPGQPATSHKGQVRPQTVDLGGADARCILEETKRLWFFYSCEAGGHLRLETLKLEERRLGPPKCMLVDVQSPGLISPFQDNMGFGIVNVTAQI